MTPHLPHYALNELTEVGVHQEALPVHRVRQRPGEMAIPGWLRRKAERIKLKLAEQQRQRNLEKQREWRERNKEHRLNYQRKLRAMKRTRAAATAASTSTTPGAKP